MKPKAYIFDIDGTVADISHRLHFLPCGCGGGSKWVPAGFKIKDMLIYVIRFHDKNFVKKRMDYITEKYILTKKDEGCQN